MPVLAISLSRSSQEYKRGTNLGSTEVLPFPPESKRAKEGQEQQGSE